MYELFNILPHTMHRGKGYISDILNYMRISHMCSQSHEFIPNLLIFSRLIPVVKVHLQSFRR